MTDRKLLVKDDNGLSEYADLSSIATFHCNDMIVDSVGRAYVGNFGYDIEQKGAEPVAAKLARVDTDGSVHEAATDLKFPNGSVITPDGKTMILAETWGRTLTAFDIGDDGELTNRREWASIHPHFPDGICLDAEMGVWVADPAQSKVIRVEEGGKITHELDPGRGAFACMLGGEDGKRLFVCTADASGGNAADRPTARIETIDVDVPRAGLP